MCLHDVYPQIANYLPKLWWGNFWPNKTDEVYNRWNSK